MLRLVIEHLVAGQNLSIAQVYEAVQELVREEVPTQLKADFLSALAPKGETVEREMHKVFIPGFPETTK